MSGRWQPSTCTYTVPRTSLQCHTGSLSWQPASATTYSATHVSTMSHRLVVMTTSTRNNVQCHARLYNVTQTRCHDNQHPQQRTVPRTSLQCHTDSLSWQPASATIYQYTFHAADSFGLQIPEWLLDWVGFTSHPTQNRSFRRRSSQPISRLSTEKTNLNTIKANMHPQQHIRAITQNRHKKLKPGLAALYDLAWKQNRSNLKEAD